MNGKEILAKYSGQSGRMCSFVSLEEMIDQELEKAKDEVVTERSMHDKLFITEILNDLHRHGFVGGKARDLLRDWASELRGLSRKKIASSRLKRIFCEEIGIRNW